MKQWLLLFAQIERGIAPSNLMILRCPLFIRNAVIHLYMAILNMDVFIPASYFSASSLLSFNATAFFMSSTVPSIPSRLLSIQRS